MHVPLMCPGGITRIYPAYRFSTGNASTSASSASESSSKNMILSKCMNLHHPLSRRKNYCQSGVARSKRRFYFCAQDIHACRIMSHEAPHTGKIFSTLVNASPGSTMQIACLVKLEVKREGQPGIRCVLC
jgi:hypothetical protein